jgi:hypothetical protein
MTPARLAAPAFALALATSAAHAAAPAGQWTATFYSEPGLARTETQGESFKADGSWYSTTVPWRGGWFRKGDRLRWYGTAAATATGTFGQLVTNRLATGEFAESYLAGGGTFNLGNWALAYEGPTCGAPAAKDAAPSRAGVTR